MTRYSLTNGFEVEEADSKEFALYHAIYLHGKYNMWYPTSMERSVLMFERFRFPYWIYHQEHKIGGVLISPNEICSLFLIPPFEEKGKVLKQLIPFVQSMSKADQPILALSVVPDDYHYYHRLGFQVVDMEKCMIRPTETFDVTWDDGVDLQIPSEENKHELAELFYEVFKESNVLSISSQTRDFYHRLVEHFLKNPENRLISDYSSSLLYERETGELIGACTVGYWEQLPQINDIVVKKEHQGKGFGSMMLKRALTILKPDYSALRLWIKVGNSAETVYHNLGFVCGIETSNFILRW